MSALEQSELVILVQEARQRRALSQVQFAEKLGVFFESVNCWESRQTNPIPIALKQVELLRHPVEAVGQELPTQYFRKLQR